MGPDSAATLAAALVGVVLLYSVAAYLRDRRPQSYVGIWRYLGEGAPVSPPLLAVFASIAFVLILVIGDPQRAGTALLPAAIAVGLAALVLVIASVAVFGSRAVLVAGPLAVAMVAATIWLPETRSAAVGVALGAIPFVLVGAFLVTRRLRGSAG